LKISEVKELIIVGWSIFWRFQWLILPHHEVIPKQNISVISCTWRSVLLVEETGVPRENHRPVASHWQTLHI